MEWNAHSLNELVLNVLSKLFDKFVRSPSEYSIVDVCIIEKKRRLTSFIFQEKYFREQQQELNTWHQDFWEKQNEKFSKVRLSYILHMYWCQVTN